MSEDTNNGNVNPDVNGTEDETSEELTAEQIADLKAKAKRAEELENENGRLKRDLTKATKPKEDKPKDSESNKSNEPDYSRLAYLEAKGITNVDDQKAVMDEAERLKLPLTDVLAMEHMQTKLRTSQEARAAQEAMPDGSGRKGGASKNSVEYFLSHPDEVPDDLDLHNKVIDAKMRKQENESKFSSVPFIG